MAKKKFVGILVLVIIFSFILSGCAITSAIGGTVDPHGLISSANMASYGAKKIAQYSVILGLFDSGYEEYAATVKEAEAAGKQIISITRYYYFFYTIKAYSN